MQVKPRAYPHPVLSYFSDDITASQFQSTVAVRGSKTAYVLSVTARTSNQELAKLIKSGKAQYAVHVECALTRYRSLVASTAEKFQFEIPASAIDGRVELSSFVLAQQDIAAYRNKDFHPDYKGLAFTVRKGDTLAVGPDATFIAEKKTDPLRRIPSIFVVVPDEDESAPAMDIDATGPKVRVSLSKANYDAYTFLRQAQPLHTVLNSMIVIPALIAVLEEIKSIATSSDGLISLESRRWYATIARRLREFGIDPTKPDSFTISTPALAHKLIGEPLVEAIKTLRSYEETETEEE